MKEDESGSRRSKMGVLRGKTGGFEGKINVWDEVTSEKMRRKRREKEKKERCKWSRGNDDGRRRRWLTEMQWRRKEERRSVG